MEEGGWEEMEGAVLLVLSFLHLVGENLPRNSAFSDTFLNIYQGQVFSLSGSRALCRICKQQLMMFVLG